MISDNAWTLGLVDEDFELPGWLFLPEGLEADEQRQWVSTALGELAGTTGLDARPLDVTGARELLESARAERAASDSHAMFQVWPSFRGETVTCHLNILASGGLPEWTEPSDDAVVHPADATHIGPGLQCTTRRVVELQDGRQVELTGVHFLFDNGDVTLLLSLDEAATPLIARALPAFVMLTQNLRMERKADGAPFEAVPPQGLVADGPWPFEEPA